MTEFQAKKEDPGQVAFKNQIKEFEANLSRVGDYLEKLSSSYKVYNLCCIDYVVFYMEYSLIYVYGILATNE